jgi:hypothetical protein
VFKVCKRRRTEGAGGTTKAHLASSGGKSESAAGRTGWSLQCTRGQRPYSALHWYISGTEFKPTLVNTHLACISPSRYSADNLISPERLKLLQDAERFRLRTMPDHNSKITTLMVEDYNFNSGERYNSKKRMRYLPVVPRLVHHPFLQHQKSRRFHCKLYVIAMQNKSPKSIAGQEP